MALSFAVNRTRQLVMLTRDDLNVSHADFKLALLPACRERKVRAITIIVQYLTPVIKCDFKYTYLLNVFTPTGAPAGGCKMIRSTIPLLYVS